MTGVRCDRVVTAGTFSLDGGTWDVENNVWVVGDGDVFEVGDTRLQTLHTPGHAPGACCFYSQELGAVFTGDTLFHGGPGATGRSFSDFPTIIDSIRAKLLSLPPGTVVHTGHGDDTTVDAEALHLGA